MKSVTLGGGTLGMATDKGDDGNEIDAHMGSAGKMQLWREIVFHLRPFHGAIIGISWYEPKIYMGLSTEAEWRYRVLATFLFMCKVTCQSPSMP